MAQKQQVIHRGRARYQPRGASSSMECVGQRLRVICRSRLVIGPGDISDPISITWITVWRPEAIVVHVDLVDPIGCEAH